MSDLNQTLFGLNWPEIFEAVIRNAKDDPSPVLIVRSDEPKSVLAMREHIKRMPDCVYVRLGVACTLNEFFRLLYIQLKCDPASWSDKLNVSIPVIVDKIKTNSGLRTIIIDNCNCIAFQDVFILLGLMFELLGLAQFIFLLTEDYSGIWEVDGTEKAKIDKRTTATHVQYKTRLFFKSLRHKYECT